MPPRAQLFTVRLWVEDLGDDRKEWRGKVQHVLSGEAQYFRDWLALQAARSKPADASTTIHCFGIPRTS